MVTLAEKPANVASVLSFQSKAGPERWASREAVSPVKPALAERWARPGASDADEFGRAVLASVVSGAGSTFVVEAPDAASITRLMTPLRAMLLVTRMGTGSASATVAPSFFTDTYPAMLALVTELERAGLGGQWRPEGVRSMRLGESTHVFVSADRPVAERTPAPDGLLEVVDSHQLSHDWFMARVAPRATSPSLTRVFSGVSGAEESAYEHALLECLRAEEGDGQRRCFSLMDAADAAISPVALSAAGALSGPGSG